ncbi:MAG: hypothetical protein LBV00_04760, partial [Propionibacteriaceae bacterium]|nr:hypothetical protein [Propionibacteriaceae bacterium]
SRPYPPHHLQTKDWVAVEPCEVRLDRLVTTKSALDLHTLLADDSTLYGDLFPHVVVWQGVMYLEDGLQRTLRAALQGRDIIHARVLHLDSDRLGCADRLGYADEASQEV